MKLREIVHPVKRIGSLPGVREAWAATSGAPIDRVISVASRADRLGYAFALGYAGALARLVPGAAAACLCITEAGGGHPRAIQARLADGRVTGHKLWATLAGEADEILVAASNGWEGDRNLVRLARVAAGAEGVRLTPMPATPFTPEIVHFEVVFDAAPVIEVLPGDGYTAYIKPFRTIEDIHVIAAAVAWLIGLGWDAESTARLCAILVALRALAAEPPDDPSVHLALAGCLRAVERTQLDWASRDPELAALWTRDAPLLRIAGRAREARFEAAWRGMGGPTESS